VKLKIVCDGTVEGTKVVDAETGKELERVTSIEFLAFAGGTVPEATITVLNPLFEGVVDAKVIKAPGPGLEKVRHICDTCQKEDLTVQPRIDNGLLAGRHCDPCWDKLVKDARSHSH
jgi:hypothetical protein